MGLRLVGLSWSFFLIERLYLSGLRLDEGVRKDTQKTCVTKRLNYMLKMLIILGSIVYMVIMNKIYLQDLKIMKKMKII